MDKDDAIRNIYSLWGMPTNVRCKLLTKINIPFARVKKYVGQKTAHTFTDTYTHRTTHRHTHTQEKRFECSAEQKMT